MLVTSTAASALLTSHLLLCGSRTRTLSCCASALPERFFAPHEPPEEGVVCTLSHFEAMALHTALHKQAPESGSVALDPPPDVTIDLGLKKPDNLELSQTHLRLGIGDESAAVPWAFLAKVAKKKRAGAWQCFDDEDEPPTKVEGCSDETRRTASLYPLEGAVPPTATLGGFNMHRVKGIDPQEDTARKLGALGGRGKGRSKRGGGGGGGKSGGGGGGARGRMLDVCTGLGYTAINAARAPAVSEVVTIELDPLMVYMQRANPWSAPLFDDAKIRRLLGDATEVLPELPDEYFDCAVHDPPANAMSGELYSLEFYSQLRRVLRNGGTLFHYIGDPTSKASGRLFKGILERLREAGFEPTVNEAAFGISAVAR